MHWRAAVPGLNLGRRQSATMAGASTEQARVCSATPTGISHAARSASVREGCGGGTAVTRHCAVTYSSRSNFGRAIALVGRTCHLRRWSADVRARPRLFVGVVTQLDTHPVRLPTRWASACQLSSPGLGMAVPVSQMERGDLGSSPWTPVTAGRRWPLLSGLGRPRDGPKLWAPACSDQLASRPVQGRDSPWQSAARVHDASSSTARPTAGGCAVGRPTARVFAGHRVRTRWSMQMLLERLSSSPRTSLTPATGSESQAARCCPRTSLSPSQQPSRRGGLQRIPARRST